MVVSQHIVELRRETVAAIASLDKLLNGTLVIPRVKAPRADGKPTQLRKGKLPWKVMKLIAAHRDSTFKFNWLQRKFKAEPTVMSAALRRLLDQKQIKRAGRGLYRAA